MEISLKDVACGALALALGAPATALAGAPSATLAVSRGQGADACPDAAGLRAAIAARLGYDPFRTTPSAPTASVEVAFVRADSALHAHVKLRQSGEPERTHDLTSTEDDCSELAQATSLAIGIALDPDSFARATPPLVPAAPAPPPVVAPPRAPPPAPPPVARSAGAPVLFHVAASGVVAFGAAPSTAAGVALEGGLRYRAASLAVEGRALAPASTTAPNTASGSVRSTLLLASLLPCGNLRFARLCALASFGALQGAGVGVQHEERATSLYAAIGGRAGAFVPLGDTRFSILAQGDVAATVTRTTLALDGEPVWITPPIAGALLLGLDVRIP